MLQVNHGSHAGDMPKNRQCLPRPAGERVGGSQLALYSGVRRKIVTQFEEILQVGGVVLVAIGFNGCLARLLPLFPSSIIQGNHAMP
jgi:hypothetical protein